MIHGPTLVDPLRCERLYELAKSCLALNQQGEIWECGVYRGGTALLLADAIRESGRVTLLRLFDTFSGHPFDDAGYSEHRQGGFSDVRLEEVKGLLFPYPFVMFHCGVIPQTFSGGESSQILFAHVDVDLYQSTLAALEFIWPRLVPGGILLDDDYGAASCPGAKQAMDEFFAQRAPLLRGAESQAYVVKKPF